MIRGPYKEPVYTASLEYEDSGIWWEYEDRSVYLTGVWAFLYKGLVWMNGKEEADREFYDAYYGIKNSATRQDNAVPAL